MVVRFTQTGTTFIDGWRPVQTVKGHEVDLTPWDASYLVMENCAEYVDSVENKREDLENHYRSIGGKPRKIWSNKKLKRMIEQLEGKRG